MENAGVEKTHNNALMIAVIVIEVLAIFGILLIAAYLFLNIQLVKSAQKSTSTSDTTTSDADCPTGQERANEQRGSSKVLGKEKITVDRKALNLCCAVSATGGQETKVCSDKSNSVIVMYTKVNGQFVLANEMFSRDGKKCTKYYKDSAQSGEFCL